MASTVTDIKSLIEGPSQEIRVGYSFSAAFCLETLIERIASEQAGIAVSPVELYGPLAQLALLDNEIDLGFIWFPAPHPDIETACVAHRPFVAVLRDDDPLADRQSVQLHELANHEFVLSPRTQNPGFYDAIHQRCAFAGFDPNVRQHVGGFRSVRTIISNTGGVGMTVDTSTLDVDLGNTNAIPITDIAPSELHLATRKDAATRTRQIAALLAPAT